MIECISVEELAWMLEASVMVDIMLHCQAGDSLIASLNPTPVQ
jgi:hypothetical protein